MPWRNVIMRHKDGSVGLHEAHFNKGASTPHSATADSVIGSFDTAEDLIASLHTMLGDVEKYPDVFTPPEEWGI